MDNENVKLLKGLIGESYCNIAQESRNTFNKKVRILLEKKKIPEVGFSDNEIEIILREFANMDANNSSSFCGVGEREGRVFSNLVRNRHFGFSHGVGRSGDVSARQPKAAGSSVMAALVNHLVLHLCHIMGMRSAKAAVLIPMATGMTLSLAMTALRPQRPLARYVLWPRIDQRSCFKAAIHAGFEPLLVEPLVVGDELQTDVEALERLLRLHGADSVLCVLTTTSCFAPRVPDDIVKVSRLCAEWAVPHLVNNAYGLTLRRCMRVLEEASRHHGSTGVHVVVQSADKNLLVPVGGAIAVSSDPRVIARLSAAYAGRASASAAIDVLITLLAMGVHGFTALVDRREANFALLKERLAALVATEGGGRLRLLSTPHNPVSLAVAFVPQGGEPSQERAVTEIGARLFHRAVSGSRVVECALNKPQPTVIEGHAFVGFGSHSSSSTLDYINVAAAIGQSAEEIDVFIKRFTAVLDQFRPHGDHKISPGPSEIS